jgi:tetratricopeptide (TPR) repeat protein
MAVRVKSLDDMIREIIASLQAGESGRPAFTLLVGSGFSFPIIPTPTQMLKGDIAWWRYCKQQRIAGPFRHQAEVVGEGKAVLDQIVAFEREMWKEINAKAAGSKVACPLAADGLPDLSTASAVGLAYQAVMAEGLMTNRMRRQYLRDAIERSYPKVNGAHIFLAGILEAQETWDWGAPFCRTIFTTNFDPLLQRSLQLVNKLYYMTDRPDVLEPPDDDESTAIHLVYTHGSVHRYDLVNTEDQIKHARERNAPTLIEYFRRHGVIVIGYSGWADTTMEALASCPSFDSNLYWCDVHPAADAETRLRPEVLKILEAPEKHAYYVPIAGADEAMRLLHRELKLGDVPKFILAPVDTMITQLTSIDVPPGPAASSKSETTQLSTSLADLLERTLTRLNVAKSAFDDPSIVKPASTEGEEEVAKALIAQLLSDAEVAYSQGKLDHAIVLWSTVIATPAVPAKDRATALYNRGVASGESGEKTEAIADYTAVIDMPDAPAVQKAMSLYNRGNTWGKNGEMTKAIADYTAVIDMPDAPTVQKAQALNNRGFAWGKSGDTMKEITDYTTVIDMPDAPAVPKATALNNRGFVWVQRGESTKAIADYTAVIDMADSPADQKAMALNSRGVTWRRSGESTKAIADFTSVIDMPDSPADQKAVAFLHRGWARFADLSDARSMVGDSQKALEITDNNLDARSNLALGLLFTGEADAALAEYATLLARTSDTAIIQAAIDDLETALRKRPEIAGAARILDRLRNSLPGKNDDGGGDGSLSKGAPP